MSRLPFVVVLAMLLSLSCVAAPAVSPTPAPADTATPEAPAVVASATPAATSAPASSPTPSPGPPPQATGRVVLNAVGDLMLARDIQTLMEQNGPAYPFAAVQPLLSDADLTIANMEGAFTLRGEQQPKFYTFRTPPSLAIGLAQAGIDVVSLGNNHTMDYGPDGLTDTLAALDAAGVPHSGAGPDETSARAPVFLDSRGLRIAFLSYNAVLEATFASGSSPGVARASVAAIRQDVAAARTQADVVVVSMHAGTEYTDAPTAEQRSLARAAIDSGAALVLGSHPHVLQGWERYGKGVIIYSLGNFVFDLDTDDLATLGPRPFQTIVFTVELTRDGVGEVTPRPVFIDPAQNRPLPATPEQAAAIEQRLKALSAGLTN